MRAISADTCKAVIQKQDSLEKMKDKYSIIKIKVIKKKLNKGIR